ncbi:MAG: hypothetical protein ACNS61_16170 [Candidatus Wenzhouxiangella sp. M2_3B_020]
MSGSDFSFSFSMPASPKKPEEESVRYIAAPYDAHAVGREALVRPTGQAEIARLPLFHAQVLGTCDAFRTLDAHRQAATAALGLAPEQSQLVGQSLHELVRRGLLRDEASIVSELGSGPDDDTVGAIRTLYVRTCDRPHELERLLEELDRVRSGSGLERVVVLDDSRDAANAARNVDIVAGSRLRERLSIGLVARDERRALVRRIADAAGVDTDALEWTIEGDPGDSEPGYGSNLNLALLLGAGTRFAIVDEDAGMEPRAPAAVGRSLSLRPCMDFGLRFLDPDQDEREAFPASGVDPLAAHSEILGRTVAGLVDQFGPQQGDLAHRLTPHLIHELRTGPRVRLTCNGTLGDPGVPGMAWLFAREPEEYAPLCRSRDDHERLLFGRRLAMWTPDVQIAAGAALMTTTLTGIDGRDLLLPTLPRGRGEDLLFGALVRFLHPASPCAMLPWMLQHRSMARSGASREDLGRARDIGLAAYVAERIEDLEESVPPAGAPTRSEALRLWLRGCAEESVEEIVEHLRRQLLQRRADLAAQASETLRSLDPPPWLQSDFETVIEANKDFSDVSDQRLRALANNVRGFAARYSDSLEAWRTAWHWSTGRSVDELLDPQ